MRIKRARASAGVVILPRSYAVLEVFSIPWAPVIEPPAGYVNPAAREAFDFVTDTDFEEGLRATIEWYERTRKIAGQPRQTGLSSPR